MKSFLSRFGALISLVLSGFDRLRLVGDSRLLNNARGVDSYLYQQRVRYVDFPAHAAELTHRLRTQTEQRAKDNEVPVQHLNCADVDKEALALELAQRHQRTTGPIAVLTSVETCLTYSLRKNDMGWVKPVKERRKCLRAKSWRRSRRRFASGSANASNRSPSAPETREALKQSLGTRLFDLYHATAVSGTVSPGPAM